MALKLLREKIRELDLRIIDLAKYMEMSRPTVYKYIEMYEEGHREGIAPKALAIFDYIEKSSGGKTEVVKFIVNNVAKEESDNLSDDERLRLAARSLLKSQNKQKEDFICALVADNFFDPVLGYLLQCRKIACSGNISDEERELMRPLQELYAALGYRIATRQAKEGKE